MLIDGINKITSSKEIANKLAETFCKNSSNEVYTKNFQINKKKAEENLITITDNNLSINTEIKKWEVELALADLKNNKSPGPDNIPFEFLKHLPDEAIKTLTEIFNYIWSNKQYPDQWREIEIIPLPKANKTRTDPKNYRPIALTNTIGKLFEKIINKRLVWYLEKNNILNKYQCGFRANRGTVDQIVSLVSEIHVAFKNKQHILAIFFDLNNAFPSAWPRYILNQLINSGLDGNIIHFIQNFLKKKNIKVRTNGELSESKTLENGIPQGSVLSTTLFLMAVNQINEHIKMPETPDNYCKKP